jgi:hypothetical protein
MVIPDTHHKKVVVRGRRTMTPAQARDLAIEILHAADEAENNEVLGAYGYQVGDSRELGEIYSLLDEEIGWADDEQEIDRDYEARILQVGKILRRRNLLSVVKP